MLACHAIHVEGHVMTSLYKNHVCVKFVGTVTQCDLSRKNVCVGTM